MTPNLRLFPKAVACPLIATLLLAATPDASAQTQAQVKIRSVDIAAQKTPGFQAANVTEKRFKARDWLELEVEFEGKLSDRDQDFIQSLTFKYYLILNPKNRDEIRTLASEITYQNIPVDEKVFSVAYVSPMAIQKITGNKSFSKSEVTFWGVEILYGGEVVGTESSNGKPWWTSEQAPPQQTGIILRKGETPFAPLWGDYHVDEAEKS
ncbi:hypothetical protein BH23VER1_BH23VER1_29140 [soil metagenome]